MKKILLLLLLIAIMAFFYFNQSSKQALEQNSEQKLFANIKIEDLTDVSVISGSNTIKLQKQGQDWQIIQPVLSLADKNFILAFTNLINELTPESVINETEVEVRQGIYGLIPPQLVLILEGAFGKEVVSLGKHVDFASARYLQKEKDPKIYLIKEDLFTLLSSDLSLFRTNRPVEFDQLQVQSVAVIPSAQAAYVVRKRPTSWLIESAGISFEADSKLIDSALDKLGKLEVIDYIDQGAEHINFYGLDRPMLTLRILLTGTGDSRVLDLIFGKGAGKESSYYLREVGKTTIYRIFRGTMSDWNKGIDYFRSKKVFPQAPIELNGKKIAFPTGLSEMLGLSALNVSAFKSIEPKTVLQFTIGDKILSLELGDKVPSAEQDNKDSPSFVKINSENQEYVLILSAKDIEILKNLVPTK